MAYKSLESFWRARRGFIRFHRDLLRASEVPPAVVLWSGSGNEGL